MESIVYAVVIPSFILTIISFVAEISEICERTAGKRAESAQKTADLAAEVADLSMENYRAGIYEVPYSEGDVPQKILETQKQCAEFYCVAAASVEVRTFFVKAKSICDKIVVGGYVLLLLSLALSPCVVQWLSIIKLNCITLWSLALLYLTLELKKELCDDVFEFLYKRAECRITKEVGTTQQ